MDESAHHALANAGGREIVGKKEGEQKGSARGSVHSTRTFLTRVENSRNNLHWQKFFLKQPMGNVFEQILNPPHTDSRRAKLGMHMWHMSSNQ
jgi:hypothetical protein